MENFDLDGFINLDEKTGVFMPVLDPVTDEPVLDAEDNPVGIYLISSDTKKFRSAAYKANDRLNRAKNADATTEDAYEMNTESLARSTVSWNGIQFKGEMLECNYRNAVMLYDSLPWVREQVNAFIQDRGNYLVK
jgi:hypothetical protein